MVENVYGFARNKRCLVIAKGAKIYGLVDFARSRYPFHVRGKAKLFVYVDSIKLESGEQISISFAEPLTRVPPKKPSIRECKTDGAKKCIAGRRDKLTFSPSIIAVGAGTATALITDPTARALAGLSFIESLSKASGVDSLINLPNAQLKKQMIFDVVVTDETSVFLAVTKDEKNKKTEDK